MIDDVLALMQEAAERAILPRFRALQASDIEDKSPGEVVTIADREAEAIIERGLRRVRPDATVVGEEGAAANPSLVGALRDEAPVWLVDPLDGTSNFIAGSDAFAVLVALVEGGITTHAWIWRPLSKEGWIAQRGAGSTLNGTRVRHNGARPEAGKLRGSVRTRFLDKEHQDHVGRHAHRLGEILPGSGCAGADYPEVIMGRQDFILFRRTLPWDHAPGVLLLEEAGGVGRRWDGSDFSPARDAEGLLAARDEATWRIVEQALLQARHRAPA